MKFEPLPLFWRNLVLDYLLYWVPAVLAFFLLRKKNWPYHERRISPKPGVTSYLLGYFAPVGLSQALLNFSHYTSYRLFLLPFLSLLSLYALIASIQGVLIKERWQSYLYLTLPLLSSVAGAGVALLYTVSRDLLGGVLFVVVLGIGGTLFFSQHHRKTPRRKSSVELESAQTTIVRDSQ
ncbi:MAG TPA: hypothetical protein ENN41_10615 [Sediminispirochaeta sp.]|nr:hypothetical protein [Sediminispirochaeta sp.]